MITVFRIKHTLVKNHRKKKKKKPQEEMIRKHENIVIDTFLKLNICWLVVCFMK